MSELQVLIETTSWPYWRKDQMIQAMEALAEAQLIIEGVAELPQEPEFRQRFAAAFLLLAKSQGSPSGELFLMGVYFPALRMVGYGCAFPATSGARAPLSNFATTRTF